MLLSLAKGEKRHEWTNVHLVRLLARREEGREKKLKKGIERSSTHLERKLPAPTEELIR